MLKFYFSEIFEFSRENSWILKEIWPNSDLKSSNGSFPRRSNLSTQLRALLRHAVAAREVAGLGQGHPEVRVPTAVRVHERVGGLCMATKDTSE